MQENLDYILFSLFAILGFAVLMWALPRWRAHAEMPKAVVVIALVILVGSWWSVDRAGRVAGQSIERIFNALTPTYAVELEQLGHEQITLETDPESELYQAMRKRILEWQKACPLAHDIYTVRRLKDGRFVFIVDPETDYNRNGRFDGVLEERTPIGTHFNQLDQGLTDALKGIANFNPEVITDQWGSWVGAWAPVRGANGRVEAAVGVDYNASEWLAAIRSARQGALVQLGMFLTLLALGGSALGLIRADNLRRRAIEARSKLAEARMALTLRKMPLAFIEWNTKAECVAWNPTAERVFGHSAESVIGKAIHPLIVAPSAREHVEKVWSHLMNQIGGTHSINDNVTRDGRTIICEWFNSLITDADGNVTGAFSLVQDITERVNLEKHVQHAQRLNAVGQLAAGVAHDFNNILTIITGHAGLVLDCQGLPDDVRPDLERIEEAALRASGLTRQLLAFSRQQAMFPRPLHLGEVVENSAAMLARVLSSEISFNVRLESDLPPIEADPAMLDQVITNLVLNARDAVGRGGQIILATERVNVTQGMLRDHPDASVGESVCLSVTDNGAGIAPENLNRLFEPFFTTKQTGKGTGLGLSVVHGIVKQHHGWIKVESTLHKGTTFRLFFPPTTKTPAADAGKPVVTNYPIESNRRKTILLAEDESIVRELARMILERAGYHVLDAADGVQAFEYWREHRDEIDLLLTDMVMPNGITGRELSLRILAEDPNLPVVFASGYSIELTAPDFRESERQIFLQKPYLTDQLVSTVRRCLGEEPQRAVEVGHAA